MEAKRRSPMRVAVTGGRDFDNLGLVLSTLDHLPKDTTIIEGGAIGADFLCRCVAKYFGMKVETFPADWKENGRAAGFIRNQQVIDEGQPDLGIVFPGGTGTEDMKYRLMKAGIPIQTIEEVANV